MVNSHYVWLLNNTYPYFFTYHVLSIKKKKFKEKRIDQNCQIK